MAEAPITESLQAAVLVAGSSLLRCMSCGAQEYVLPLDDQPIDELYAANYLCDECEAGKEAQMPMTQDQQEFQEGIDFYYDENGLMVFTAAYHLKRGYCCESGCRHCPYGEVAPTQS